MEVQEVPDPLPCRPVSPREKEKWLWLAMYRAVDPLGATHITLEFERSWQEMKPAEVRRFLKAGFAREEVMLARERDPQRLAGLTPPQAFFNSMVDPDDLGDPGEHRAPMSDEEWEREWAPVLAS